MEYKEITNYPCTDILDREVKIGDVLAYSVRSGSYHAMHFGKVYDIVPWRQEYGYGDYISLITGFTIKIVICSKEFQYSASKYNLNSRYRKFLNEQIDSGNVPTNWDTCYVKFPKKTEIGLKRAIIIDSSYLPQDLKRVILNEEWFVDDIRVTNDKN